MDGAVVNLQIPESVYIKLQTLAAQEQTDPVTVIARLVGVAHEQVVAPEADLLFDLIGTDRSQRPLIDDIPVSEDPDLYLVAEALGDRANGLHAWEIAPARYIRGQDGHPLHGQTVELC